MKKLTVILLALVVIGIICIYLFIPADLVISKTQLLPFPDKVGNRSFNDTAIRKKWWPENELVNGDQTLINHATAAFLKPDEINFQHIIIGKGTNTLNSDFNIAEYNQDSSLLKWVCHLHSGASPVNRVRQYLMAVRIKKVMDRIIDSFTAFTANESNVYGLAVRKVTVTDSVLISEKRIFAHYPSMKEVYEIIHSLGAYLTAKGARQVNPPMLNIVNIDSSHYQAMAAIPIDKSIPEDDTRKIKRMLYGGFLLTAEVKGGVSEINRMMKHLDHYRQDHGMLSPAIPYQSLVTDRSMITDSTKWETKIYYPVFY